jgi:hypothetical protein
VHCQETNLKSKISFKGHPRNRASQLKETLSVMLCLKSKLKFISDDGIDNSHHLLKQPFTMWKKKIKNKADDLHKIN